MDRPRTTTRKRKTTRAAFGSVRRLPSGRYQARYSDADLNRYTAPTTFPTKRDAEDWLATTRADMVRGTWRAPHLGQVTLSDYAHEHLAARIDLAPKTRQMYAEIVARWIDSPLVMPPGKAGRERTLTLGRAELGALSLASIRQWHAAALHTAALRAAARAERHQQRTARETTVHAARAWARGEGIAVPDTGRLPSRILDAWRNVGSPEPNQAAPGPLPVTNPEAGRAAVAQAYRFLRTLLGQAVREGRILANPCDIPGAGVIRTPERRPATLAEIEAIADAMPDRYAAAVHLAAWSALRAGELFGLTRANVDLDAGTLRVEHQAVTCVSGVTPYLGPTKTQSSRRTVHIPAPVAEILRDHMDRFTGPAPDALVFTSPEGAIVSREARQRAYAQARRAAGRPDLRWHDLRHTGATMAAQAGATLRELQHRLGHATVSAAMTYQHAAADRDRLLAERMAAQLDSDARPVLKVVNR